MYLSVICEFVMCVCVRVCVCVCACVCVCVCVCEIVPVPKEKLLQLSVAGRKASSKAFSKLKAHIFP